MVRLRCPKCQHVWSYKNYFLWVLRSPFHWIGISPRTGFPEDYRKTKCPSCGVKSWVTPVK